jgi:hypothetical protein
MSAINVNELPILFKIINFVAASKACPFRYVTRIAVESVPISRSAPSVATFVLMTAAAVVPIMTNNSG